jgi:hypothetical protein
MLCGELSVKNVSGFWKEAEFTGEVRPLGVTSPASYCTEVASRATCCTAALPDCNLVLLLRLRGISGFVLLCGAAGSGFGSASLTSSCTRIDSPASCCIGVLLDQVLVTSLLLC